MEEFRVLGISEETLSALEKKGFHTPTPIQLQAIPILLNSRKDVIGQAQTGTGKTAAFGIPILERIDSTINHVQALVLTPTRELASQVCEEIKSLSGNRKLKLLPVYGGAPIGRQLTELENGVHVVVGTPGRVMDMIKRKKLDLQHLRYAVLDEADEMLNMGFLEDVESILSATNDDKQVLLFSATMPQRIMQLAKRTMGEFEVIKVKEESLTTALIDQMYYQVGRRDFFEALCRILDMEKEVYGIIFCNTRREVAELSNNLNGRGYKTDAIHGDIEQNNREKVIDLFKRGGIQILVATDVAARGIDVSNLSHVINYGLPQDIESYVHRIGRTGRAGLEGKAISLVQSSDIRKLNSIERLTGITIDKEKLPDAELMVEMKKERLRHSLSHSWEQGYYEKYLAFAADLLQENEADKIIAGLLDHFYKKALDPNAYNNIEESSRPARKSKDESRLFVAKGKDDGMITPKQLISFISSQTGVQAKDIQSIKIFDSFSFFNAPNDVAELIVDVYRNEATKGKKPLVVKAKEEDGGGTGFRSRPTRDNSPRERSPREATSFRSHDNRDGGSRFKSREEGPSRFKSKEETQARFKSKDEVAPRYKSKEEATPRYKSKDEGTPRPPRRQASSEKFGDRKERSGSRSNFKDSPSKDFSTKKKHRGKR